MLVGCAEMGLYDPQPHIGGTRPPDGEGMDALLATEEEAAALADLIGFHVTYEVHYLPGTDSRVFTFHLQAHARAGLSEQELREVPDLEEAAARIRPVLIEGARRVLFPDDVSRDLMLRKAWEQDQILVRVHGYDEHTFEEWLANLRRQLTETP